jgi:hypothetical protein
MMAISFQYVDLALPSETQEAVLLVEVGEFNGVPMVGVYDSPSYARSKDLVRAICIVSKDALTEKQYEIATQNAELLSRVS